MRTNARPTLHLGRFTTALFTVIALTLLMAFHFLPDRVSLQIGDRSSQEIRANRSVTFIDTEATQRRKDYAASRVRPIYETDSVAETQANRFVTDLFDNIMRIRRDPSLQTDNRRLTRLSKELGSLLSPELVRYIHEAPNTTIDLLKTNVQSVVQERMAKEIRAGTADLEAARKLCDSSARKLTATDSEARIITAIAQSAIRTNNKVNEYRTQRLRDEAARIAPIERGDIRAGDVIIRPGDLFTARHMDECTALGLVSPRLDVQTFLAITGIAIFMVVIIGVYLRRYCRHVYENPGLVGLLASIVIVSVLGLKLFVQVLGIPLSVSQIGFFGLMTVVAAGMIIAELLDAFLAVLVTAMLAVVSGLLLNHELRFSVMTLISSLVGIYSAKQIRDRMHLLRVNLALAVANVALVWIIGGLQGDTIREVITGTIWSVVAATFAVGMFWFAVMALEKPFGILTRAWLLELSNSEHPLLKELTLQAPGTYAHSIMVANLAEAAADAVGADGFFCRVASYYHDVGKIRRPHCFVENQMGENLHESLNPSLSALIIAAHVKDGLEFADRYRMPPQIRSVIGEHHGTTLIRYFYHQAVAELGSEGRFDPVLEEHFRYEGPKPQSRESGIIMLADTVEAAARCLQKPTPARLQGLIVSLIQEKLSDGQLDECDLTLKDIGIIRTAFLRVLTAVYHARIDYPDSGRSEAATQPLSLGDRNGNNHPVLTELPSAAEVIGSGSSTGSRN